jgi:membrane-bound serine protease (ClpP class)
MDETMASKVMNDTKAFMRSIAIERGRNEIEAENFVTHATSLTDAEALKKNIVNLIIENESDLLTSIHKKEITFQKEKFIFETEGSKIIEVKPRMIDTILTHIAHPQLSYMLMSIGSIGLIYEITHPGVILPGVAGAIALILGLIALQTLPVSTGMMSLLFLGIAMMVAEIFVPSFGALGIGGLIAFFLGSLYLFDDPTVRVPLSLVFSITGSIGSVFLFLGYLIASSRRRKKIDHFSLVGLEGNAISDFKDSGWVFVNGERWKAQSKTEIKNGDKVIVKQMISNSKIEVEKLTKGI